MHTTLQGTSNQLHRSPQQVEKHRRSLSAADELSSIIVLKTVPRQNKEGNKTLGMAIQSTANKEEANVCIVHIAHEGCNDVEEHADQWLPTPILSSEKKAPQRQIQ